MNPSDVAKMRMQYLGVLSLLGETSVHMREHTDAEELRLQIERALEDARGVIPQLRWKRTLNAFTVEIEDEAPEAY